VPAPERRSELTISAVVLGVLLSVVMGAANVYLGLKVGMTVSASIPAAVIALAILNGVMRRTSVLEANLVQTSASAGESLAAGVIFTMPALLLAGVWSEFDYWTTTLIALSGGLLGILFMIPMRRVFIVDNDELQYPEGVACAEVLRTAEQSDEADRQEGGAMLILFGLSVGAVIKVAESFGGLIKGGVEWATVAGGRVFYFGSGITPALVAVGTIVGLPIAAQIFTGGAISWLVAIPLISDGTLPDSPAVDLAGELWSTQIRYMGVGAMLVGGVVSIWKVRSGLLAAVGEIKNQFAPQSGHTTPDPTEQNIGTGMILALSALTVLLIGGIYYHLLKSPGVTLLTTVIMIGMSFFFTAVASYIVGLVGNSNSPVSGMTITAVLGTALLLYAFDALGLLAISSERAILATLGVAGIVCCVACTAGDVCNDLKTGFLVGASPRNQQILQVAGVFSAAFVMAPVMSVLHEASKLEAAQLGEQGGLGTASLPAPQAVLFSELAKGFFGDGQLPWNMIAIGVGIGIALIIADAALQILGVAFRLHVMPVAVGIYLPFSIAVPILIGGLIHFTLSRAGGVRSESRMSRGVLLASGAIAGESLVGVAYGAFVYFGGVSIGLAEQFELNVSIAEWLNVVDSLGFIGNLTVVDSLSVFVLLSFSAWVYWVSARNSARD